MRTRLILAIASLLLLPAGAGAQLVPGGRIRRPHPADPAPLPPTAGPIARAVSYQRMRISVETYPALSFIQTSAFANTGSSAWTTLGAGTHADYRVTRLASATLDFTSSVLGGPVHLQTVELGTRLHHERSERGVDPFVDVRLGYFAASAGTFGTVGNDPFGVPLGVGSSILQYSRGWGGIAGGGLELGITRTFSMTTELLAVRGRMTSHQLDGQFTADPSFALTSLRLTLGLTYNPVRTLYR
jgi:hypothetical protein